MIQAFKNRPASSNKTLHTLLISDQEILSFGIIGFLEETSIEFHHVTSSSAACLYLEENPCDVLMLDVSASFRERQKTFETIHESFPDLPILVMVEQKDPLEVGRWIAWGAANYFEKGIEKEEFLERIHTVGEQQLPKNRLSLLENLFPRTEEEFEQPNTPLTKRETEILVYVSYGLKNREIAKILTISPETVKEHVQSVLRKLHVNSRTEAAVWAVKKSLIR